MPERTLERLLWIDFAGFGGLVEMVGRHGLRETPWLAGSAGSAAEADGWVFNGGELSEGVVGQFEDGGGEVLFEVLHVGGSGDGEGRGRAAEEPGKRDLLGRGVQFAGDVFEHLVAVTGLAERSPGDESDAILVAVVEEVIPLAIGEAVAVLDGDNGGESAGAFQVIHGDVAEADVADFALFLESDEGFDGSLEGDGRVGDVELVQGDAVETEAVEASMDGFFEVFGAGVVGPLAGSDALPTSLGGDDKIGGVGMEGFRDEFFCDVGAVGVGSIDEIHAEIDGAMEDADGFEAIFRRAPDASSGDAHGSIAETVNDEIAQGDSSYRGRLRRANGQSRHRVPPRDDGIERAEVVPWLIL